ncbi:MAG: hypothetical protein II929_01265 [Succinivibrio sp.]|nr:hypothetical protein [Succinivibrio sp.]MDY6420926.1 hypothetical protein [Succinivibrio dextrinosolvens]
METVEIRSIHDTVTVRDISKILNKSYRTAFQMVKQQGFPEPLPNFKQPRRWIKQEVLNYFFSK